MENEGSVLTHLDSNSCTRRTMLTYDDAPNEFTDFGKMIPKQWVKNPQLILKNRKQNAEVIFEQVEAKVESSLVKLKKAYKAVPKKNQRNSRNSSYQKLCSTCSQDKIPT